MRTSNLTLQYLLSNLKLSVHHFALLLGHWERWCQLQHIHSEVRIDNAFFWQHLLQEIQQISFYSTAQIAKRAKVSEELLAHIGQSAKLSLSLTSRQIESLLELHKEIRPDLLYSN